MVKTRFRAVALVALIICAPATARVVEETFELPVEVKDIHGQAHRQSFTVTVFRDEERAKAPFVVISHGRGTVLGRAYLGRSRYPDAARYFVSRGFAVFVPTRVGYGMSGGPDVEHSGPCSQRDFAPVFEAGAVQVMAVIRYAKTLPFVDPTRGLIVGQSVGGAITLALSAKNIEGVLGAINFAGGSGGNPYERPEDPCSEATLRRVFASYGTKARTPTLWLYSENDMYWGRDYPHAWFKAFRAQGARAEFVQLPAYRDDGHGSFTRNPAEWK